MIVVYVMLGRKKNALTTIFIVRAFKIIYKVILYYTNYAINEYCTVAAVTPPLDTALTSTVPEL